MSRFMVCIQVPNGKKLWKEVLKLPRVGELIYHQSLYYKVKQVVHADDPIILVEMTNEYHG
jgi:hypothetical protein